MSDDRIKISWDDIQAVPERPPVNEPPPSAGRETWGHVGTSVGGISGNQLHAGPIFNRAWFYLGVAGFLSGLLAWGVSEVVNPELHRQEATPAHVRQIEQQAAERTPNWKRLTPMEQVAVAMAMYASHVRLETGYWFAFIGAILAAGLGMAEGVVSRSGYQTLRGGALGLAAGALGGFLAGYFAQWLYASLQASQIPAPGISATQVLARSVGWALAGAMVGATFGLPHLSAKRAFLGIIGGLAGGLLGGMLFDFIAQASNAGTVSRCIGISAIGCASGLLISVAEQVAKSAWLQIEAGRLIGKQFILYRNPTRIGAATSNEVYLFKDPSVAPEHARIERRGSRYFLIDNGSATGTRVNRAIIRDHQLRNGDAVQIGETILRYGERRTD